MGGLKAASLAGMPVTRHGGEVDGKQGDMTAVLLLNREITPDVPLDPVVAAALAPPLVASTPLPLPSPRSFFARCARRIKNFAERQSRRATPARTDE